MITIEDILSLCESEELEFKSAKGGFPKSFWETYSSFANTQGGCILLGVKETENGIRIDGMDEGTAGKYKKILWDTLNNRQKVSANVLSLNDITKIQTEQGIILSISVPRADLKVRPIYLDNNPEMVYKREHEGDYLCNRDEIRRMFAESSVLEHPLDSRILEGFSIQDDIDDESLQKYRRLLSGLHPTHPWVSLDEREFLAKLGGYRKDRKNGKEGLTLAGLIMFGKFSSIVDPDCCPAYFPDYRESETGSENRWTDRICYDGRWEANLFNFYSRVYNKLSSSLPRPFALKDGVRIDDSPMHIAIREAFVNSLIHSDYTTDKSIVIINEGSKFVFANPGSLLVSIDQYRRGGESICRNKALQQMFMFIGAAEKAGSGADKIWKGWKSANFRNPYLKQQDNKVILELPLVSIISKEIIERLKRIYGPDIVNYEHNKLLVLAACANDGKVSNASLQTVLDLHPSDITSLLKEMVLEGKLSTSGLGKGTKYELALNDENTTSRISGNKTTSWAGEGMLFHDNELITPQIEEVPDATGRISGNKTTSRRNRRTTQLYQRVLEVCHEYKSLSDISKVVERSVSHLKTHTIPELIESGKLLRKYPDTPNHPDQKYIAKEALKHIG